MTFNFQQCGFQLSTLKFPFFIHFLRCSSDFAAEFPPVKLVSQQLRATGVRWRGPGNLQPPALHVGKSSSPIGPWSILDWISSYVLAGGSRVGEPTWNQRSHVLTMSYWTQSIKYWRPNNHEPSTSNSECRKFCTVIGCNMLKLFTSLLGISPQTTGLLPTAQIQNSIKKWPNMTSSRPPQKLIAMIHRELLGATLWKSF